MPIQMTGSDLYSSAMAVAFGILWGACITHRWRRFVSAGGRYHLGGASPPTAVHVQPRPSALL